MKLLQQETENSIILLIYFSKDEQFSIRKEYTGQTFFKTLDKDFQYDFGVLVSILHFEKTESIPEKLRNNKSIRAVFEDVV